MGEQLMWSLLPHVPHVSFLIAESKTVVEYKKYIIIIDDRSIVIADLEHFALKEIIHRRSLPCLFSTLSCLISKVNLRLHIRMLFASTAVPSAYASTLSLLALLG